MNKTSIEWTHRPETGGATGGFTWNPIRARLISKNGDPLRRNSGRLSGTFCTRISPGCTNCYASTINKRFGNGLEYTVPNLEKIEFYIDEKILAEPLKRKKPATIFVGDMFDLFHEAIPAEMIERIFRTMALNEDHTYQVLTKRAERMGDWLRLFWRGKNPMTHIWCGVSVESPDYRFRIAELVRTPAAVRFLSIEPQLSEISDCGLGDMGCSHPSLNGVDQTDGANKVWECMVCNGFYTFDGLRRSRPAIDWLICGGESGPGARPFNLSWAESLKDQCKAAGVAFFFKQAGSFPVVGREEWHSKHDPLTIPPAKFPIWMSARNGPHAPEETVALGLKDRKGGDMSEWPESLRVREFPEL